jgi:hypothetical protein
MASKKKSGNVIDLAEARRKRAKKAAKGPNVTVNIGPVFVGDSIIGMAIDPKYQKQMKALFPAFSSAIENSQKLQGLFPHLFPGGKK